jgi:sugar phosphate isomerase/epimerase
VVELRLRQERGHLKRFLLSAYILKIFQSPLILNRRNFINATSVGAGSLFIANTVQSSLFSKNARLEKIGLQLFSVPKLLEQDFEGTLKTLSRIGYKELEFYGPYPFSTKKARDSWNAVTPSLGFSGSGFFGRTATQTKEMLDEYGLSAPSMHVDLDTLRKSMSAIAEAGHILGTSYIGLPAIPQDERANLDAYKRMADEFNKIGEAAQKVGLKFFYHNHGYGLSEMEGAIPFDVILQRTDPKLVFLEMDIYWMTAGGADLVKYLDDNVNRFKLMHVKDMSRQVRFSGDGGDPTQWIELFPFMTDAGSGVLDLKTIISHARKSGMEHFLVEQDRVNDTNALAKSYAYLSKLELTT